MLVMVLVLFVNLSPSLSVAFVFVFVFDFVKWVSLRNGSDLPDQSRPSERRHKPA